MPYSLHSVLRTPRPVTALTFASSNALSVGSGKLSFNFRLCNMFNIAPDDGSVRLFSLPSTTVVRAIRALGSEITSLYWATPPTEDDGELWVACGKKVVPLRCTKLAVIVYIYGRQYPSGQTRQIIGRNWFLRRKMHRFLLMLSKTTTAK